MCDITGPFKLCTCTGKIDKNMPYWVLHQGVNEKDPSQFRMGEPIIPENFDFRVGNRVIEDLNSGSAFDFEYKPQENDHLEIILDNENSALFSYSRGKWHRLWMEPTPKRSEVEKRSLGRVEDTGLRDNLYY